jgi:hypothetical protein
MVEDDITSPHVAKSNQTPRKEINQTPNNHICFFSLFIFILFSRDSSFLFSHPNWNSQESFQIPHSGGNHSHDDKNASYESTTTNEYVTEGSSVFFEYHGVGRKIKLEI